MRIFFSVDVHGSTLVWRKWVRAYDVYRVDTLVLAGDLTGKVLVPIIKQSDGVWTATYFGRRWVLKSEGEVRDFEERLEGSGAYFVRVTKEEFEELRSNPKKVEELMVKLMCDRLRSWLKFLVTHVDTKKVLTIVMPGNDDEYVIDDVIKEFEDEGIIYPVDKVLELDDLEVISSPYVNPTPWRTPRELEEKDLERHLRKLVSSLRRPEKAVLNLHCPPHNTHIDLAPKLTKDLRPIVVAGFVQYEHVGSRAVRKVIEEYQPLLGLHGHIHESGGADRIGRTVVLNPGSEYGEGVLRGYIVEVLDGGLKNYWRVEG